MRDDEELGPGGEIAQHAQEAVDVGIVERGIHLVEHAERARAVVEDGEEQRESRERPLAAGHQGHRLEPLAAGLRHQLDAGLERILAGLALDQPQLGATALEQALEELAEPDVDVLERLPEPLLGGPRHAAERLLQVLHRRDEVVVLGAQKCKPLVELAILLVRHEVDGAHRGELFLELLQPRPGQVHVLRGIVEGEERLGAPHVERPARLLLELLAPDPPLGRRDLDRMGGGGQVSDLALQRAGLRLDRPELHDEGLVLLGEHALLGLEPVPVGGDLARARVRALAFKGEPGAPLADLLPAGLGLPDAPRELGGELLQARQLPPERLDPLGR